MTNFLVIIFKEQDPVITEFEYLADAEAYADKWGANWSDVFVCKVLNKSANEVDTSDLTGLRSYIDKEISKFPGWYR